MEVRLIEEVDAFSDLTTSFMTEDPWSTNVITVQLASMREGILPYPIGAIWIAIFDGGKIVGVGMHTPPYNVFLSRLPPGAGSDIANALLGTGHSVPGVNGESSAVTDFADAWTEHTGTISVTDVAMRMYRLEGLVPPPDVPGGARRAGADDLTVVSEWFVQFHQEAQPHAPDIDMTKVAERRLDAGQLWLWIDAREPVSLAAASASAASVARIGPVYTPRERRRRGYGAAITAAATQAALDQGAAHVGLYTDLSNPTSNAIYQDIGYTPDHDAEQRSFTAPPNS